MSRLMRLSSLMFILLWAGVSFAKDNMAFHALIVSAETSYLKTEAPLNYAELDADRVARAMRKAGRTPPGSIHRLKNPTIAEFNSYVRKLSKQGQRKFLFYFSGHSDEQGLHLKDGLIDKSRFHNMLQTITAKIKVVILDSCFSGALKTKGVTKSQPISLVNYDVDEPTGSVVLTSSSGKEFSYESENLKGSIFTYHLVSGIYGQADGNEDGLVTIDELYQYVYSQTKYQNMVSGGPVQHPEFDSKLTGQGALVVSFPARINGRIKLPKGLHGELTLAAANGVTFFKFFKAKGEDRLISLPYGTYDVTVNEPSRTGTGRIELLSEEEIPLRNSELVWSDRSQDKVQSKGIEKKERMDEFLFGIKLGSHPGFIDGLEGGGSSEIFMLTPAGSFLGGGWRFAINGGSQTHDIQGTPAKVSFERFTMGFEANYKGIESWNNDWIFGLRIGGLESKTDIEDAGLTHFTFGTRFYPESFPLKFGIHLGFETATFKDSKKIRRRLDFGIFDFLLKGLGLTEKWFVLILSLSLTLAPIARADLSHKSQGQLSFVSNANYESQGEDSDWILSAEHRSSGDFSIGQMSLSGRLSKYLSEDQNDSFSWRGSYSRQQGTQDKDWTLWAGLFGTHYLEGAPATTESTFDHVGMDVGAELFRTLGRAEIAFGPYYQFKSFSSFSGRKDHTLAGYGEIMYAPKQWKLIPGAEIGFTNSSLSEYSKVFLSISFRAEARFRGPWSFEGEYLIRSTHFTSRTITQTTAISRGRGQVVFGTVETKEGHQYRELELAAVRQLFESWKFSSGIRSLSQSSKSGIEDYTSLEMFVQMSSSY